MPSKFPSASSAVKSAASAASRGSAAASAATKAPGNEFVSEMLSSAKTTSSAVSPTPAAELKGMADIADRIPGVEELIYYLCYENDDMP